MVLELSWVCLLLAKVWYNPREYLFRFCSYKRETELKLFFFFLIYLFLTGGYLLYNIVLISALHQYQPAIGIYIYMNMSPPLKPPSHLLSHPTSLDCHRAWVWALRVIQQVLLAILHILHMVMYFTYGNVFVSLLLSQLVSPTPSLALSTNLSAVSANRVRISLP